MNHLVDSCNTCGVVRALKIFISPFYLKIGPLTRRNNAEFRNILFRLFDQSIFANSEQE